MLCDPGFVQQLSAYCMPETTPGPENTEMGVACTHHLEKFIVQ